MGFGPIERLSCLIREDKGIRFTCACGHVAEPDVRTLRHRVTLKGGFWAKLSELRKYVRCGECGAKDFRFEIIPLQPPT